MNRVELACHTGYSRMKGIGLGQDWIMFAVQNNIDTIVVTDRGNVDAYVDLQDNIRSRKLDIKLIMGVDLSVYDDRNLSGTVTTSGRLSVLVRNEIGKKNLYKILSEGERKYKVDSKEVQIPLSLLLNYKEGLIIGSGTEDGLIINSIVALENSKRTIGKFATCEFNRSIYDFIDYMELPSVDCSDATYNELLDLSNYYDVPVVVTDSPYYMTSEEAEAYSIFNDISWDDCKHYHTTEELLDRFSYLGEKKAYEIVVTNSNRIADMCSEVDAVPNEKLYPQIKDEDFILSEICEEALQKKYQEITDEIRTRLKWELNAIQNTRSAFMFLQLHYVLKELGLKSFEIGSRGSVASSLVAYLCGISEIDPIAAHLSPYFFYGINGDKEPDIDLNFSEEDQWAVHEAFKNALGVGGVIKPGTLGLVSESFAGNLISEYEKKYDKYFWGTRRAKIIDELTKCISTKGLHPGGIIILPKQVDITDICPISNVGTDENVIETTSFDYHRVDHVLYKFDALRNDSMQMLKRLYELTEASPESISIDDPQVMELFTTDGNLDPQCVGIPEFDSEFVRDAMKIIKPRCFSDLVKVCGLMHGTDVWIDNARELIINNKADISTVLADRNDVYDYLVSHGIDDRTAFAIAEDVRKGKVCRGKSQDWDDWERILVKRNIPEWFTWSCKRIKYMFPRAHAYSYVLTSWRLAWYKLHYPLQFYKVAFDVRYKDDFDSYYMAEGIERLREFTRFLDSSYASDSYRVTRVRNLCRLVDEYYSHGYSFDISDSVMN